MFLYFFIKNAQKRHKSASVMLPFARFLPREGERVVTDDGVSITGAKGDV